MGVRNTKPTNGRMASKSGQVGQAGPQQIGLSNIPGPSAPPKFYSGFKNQNVPNSAFKPIAPPSPPVITTRTQKISTAPPPPPVLAQPKLPLQIDENFREPDINRLPRQTTSEDLLSAIEDVTKRRDLGPDRTQKKLEEDASAIADPDIRYLVKEVERRERKQRELDYKIKLNERKLSEKYKNLANMPQISSVPIKSNLKSDSEDPDKKLSIRKSVTIDETQITPTKKEAATSDLKREGLIRELARYDELESKKKTHLLELEKELVFNDSNELTTDGAGSSRLYKEENPTVDKSSPLLPPLSVSKSEPKRETLVIPMNMPNECGKTVNERELNKIISIIDNLEKHSGPKNGQPSRYFLDGKEIYSTSGHVNPPQPLHRPIQRMISTTVDVSPKPPISNIIYRSQYDQSQAAKKLAEIDYYLSIADRSVKAADNDHCCGYRVFNKNAELRKVDWDVEMLDADLSVANSLRRKNEIIQQRKEENRPKAEFIPQEGIMDESMWEKDKSTIKPKDDTASAIKRAIQSEADSLKSFDNKLSPTSPTNKQPSQTNKPTSLAIMRAIEAANNSGKVDSPGISMPTLQKPYAKPLSEINSDPPPPLTQNRRGSETSLSSRLSRRLKFWDRDKTANEAANSLLARVKDPLGA